MKKVFLVFWLLLVINLCASQELVVNTKGDTIVLNSDKTWKFKTENNSDKIVTLDDFKETYASDGKTLDLAKNGGVFIRNNDGTMSLIRKIIGKNGADENVNIKFSITITESQLKELGVDKINQINNKALLETKYTLKNKYTFIPREIRWTYSDKGAFKNKWLVTIKYSAQNDFGALKDGDNNLFFNIDGTEYKPY